MRHVVHLQFAVCEMFVKCGYAVLCRKVIADLQSRLSTHRAEVAALTLRQHAPLRKFGRAQIELFTDSVRKLSYGIRRPALAAIMCRRL
jgi:hypothetical protein